MDNLHNLATKRFKLLNGLLSISDEAKRGQTYESRQKAGRYTIEEASVFAEIHAGANAQSICKRLTVAASAKEINIYRPGENSVFTEPMMSRPWSDELHYKDLNDWFEKNEPLIGRIFPEPNTLNLSSDGEVLSDIDQAPVPNIHKMESRNRLLDAEINRAIENSLDKSITQSIWDALVKMAVNREGCLLGLGEDNEIKYGTNADIKILTKDNLRDRLYRKKKRGKPR